MAVHPMRDLLRPCRKATTATHTPWPHPRTAATARPNPAAKQPSLETGLHYARSYATLTGGPHVTVSTKHEGFPLGRWLLRQRRQADLYTKKFSATYPADPHLSAIDRGGTTMERSLGDQPLQGPLVDRGLQLVPSNGFPGTPESVGQWLYAQCVAYQELHPEQQRRLAQLGVTRHHIHSARPRRVSQRASFAAGLVHARAYTVQHGHLAISRGMSYNDYALGLWLANKRKRASDSRLPQDQVEALNAIDPWWNPPWRYPWQLTYHTTRATIRDLPLDPVRGFPDLPAGATRWLITQCTNYNDLHPGQQQLLADLGITAQDALRAKPQRESRQRPHPGAPQPRPSTVSSSIDGWPALRTFVRTSPRRTRNRTVRRRARRLPPGLVAL
ncbi:helicase associated domain-containing protein [Streptomyces nigrescens]